MKFCFKKWRCSSTTIIWVCQALALLFLNGCGGGSSKVTSSALPSPTSFGGTVASGFALANANISAKCLNASTTATSSAVGTYSLTLPSSATFPCLLQVNSGNTTYYSVVNAGQTVANITPLTQLVVANALGADPAAVFQSMSSAQTSKLTPSSISTAISNISSALSTAGITLPNNINPVSSAFTAATNTNTGDSLDQSIDTLMSALSASGSSISALSSSLQTYTSATAASFSNLSALQAYTKPALMSTTSSSYSMQSLPIVGFSNYHSPTQIIYASLGNDGFLVLNGSFTYPSDINSLSIQTTLTNLAGVSGTINTIKQFDGNQNLVMSISQLGISAASMENYIEAADWYDIWQLVVPSAGIDLQNTVSITCPTPSNGSTPNSLSTSVINQNIATFIKTSCVQ